MSGISGGDIFTRVEDRNDRVRVFQHIIKNKIIINGHTGGGLRFSVVPMGFKGARIQGAITPKMEKNTLKDVSMMFQVGEERYFCKTRVEEFDGNEGYLDVSEPLFKLQRRDSYRLSLSAIPNSIFKLAKVNGEEKKAELSMVNISGGGFALEIQPHEGVDFQSRDGVGGRIIVPNHIDEEVEAEVRYCRPKGSQGSGFKSVGLQFSALAPFQEQRIIQSIFEIHRIHFSRADLEKFK